MQIGVIGTGFSALAFIDRLPHEDSGVHLFDDSFEGLDYIVCLLDNSNKEELSSKFKSIWEKHSDRMIVCCIDDAAYDYFAANSDRHYFTWWTITVDQALDLIKMRAKPVVNNSDLQV